MKKFSKLDKKKRTEIFKERKRLIKVFLKKYGEPVLVHSTPTEKVFKTILTQGKLSVPKKTNKRVAYVERKIGIYPSIFLSLGFVYASAYDFKYSFIFDLDYLKKARYYKNSLSYGSYAEIARYWAKHSPEYLEKLANKSKQGKEVVTNFYNEEYQKETQRIFEFWKAEKEIAQLIEHHPKKAQLIKIMKKIAKEKYEPYPTSRKHATKKCLEDVAPEIISKKDIGLTKEPAFKGFYIKGRIPSQIKKVLKTKFPDKILFDGKTIKKIDSL